MIMSDMWCLKYLASQIDTSHKLWNSDIPYEQMSIVYCPIDKSTYFAIMQHLPL